MKHWKIIILLSLVFIFSGSYMIIRSKNFEEKRLNIIFELDSAIAKAKESGDYKCCIEPACRMCYLGSWLFEDGKCDCDGFIASGELDKVCPECKKGIESGTCESI